MARFYGSMRGNRGEVTRCGTQSSGLEAHVRGWRLGAKVVVSHSPSGIDTIHVYSTHGSGGNGKDKLLLTLRQGGITEYNALGLDASDEAQQAAGGGEDALAFMRYTPKPTHHSSIKYYYIVKATGEVRFRSSTGDTMSSNNYTTEQALIGSGHFEKGVADDHE